MPKSDNITIRGKMKVTGLAREDWMAPGAAKVTLRAQYDMSTPEDARFSKATPSGEMTMQVDNPFATEFFQLGKTLYVDFSAAE